jgi:hypothetical protein
MTTHTRGPRTSTPPAPRVNAYGGRCRKCAQWIAPREGVALKDGAKWVVEHSMLTGCPAPKAPVAPAAQPELGYYVRADGAAIKVVEAKRVQPDGSRRRYGLVFTAHAGARPSWDYVRGAGISVATLRPMTAADAAGLGLSHGHCINCCRPLGGESLSAAVSALIGYGETCAGHNGWPYPKGVKAQRAFVAERGA